MGLQLREKCSMPSGTVSSRIWSRIALERRRRVTMFDILNGTQKIGEGRERRVWFDDGKGLLIKVGRLKD